MTGKPSSGADSFRRDESGATPVLADIVMVGVTVVISMVVIVLLLNTTSALVATGALAHFDASYDDSVREDFTDSFGTTNENGTYDGVLEITHTSGRAIDAESLGVTGASSLNGTVRWTESVEGGDGPAYRDSDEVTSGDTLVVWVQRGDTVRLTWHDENGGSTELVVWRESGA